VREAKDTKLWKALKGNREKGGKGTKVIKGRMKEEGLRHKINQALY
jgi:hypothetical protein